MARKYGSIVTQLGKEKIAAAMIESGSKVTLKEFAVGDGNGTYYQPTEDQTALKKERWRGQIHTCKVNEESPNMIEITAIIPADIGGFTIREIAAFDTAGTMIVIANTPDTEKVVITNGAIGEIKLTIYMAVSNADAVELQVDPNLIVATKKEITEMKTALENKISEKAKINGSVVAGNFLSVNEAGELVDSGQKPSDFGSSASTVTQISEINTSITEITSELANKQKKNIIKTIAIENSAWEDYSDSNNDYKKKKIVAVENLTADDIVYLNYDLSCKAAAQDANASHVESESGQIVVYAESVPSKALTAQLVIQKS